MFIKDLNGRNYGTNMKALHEALGIDWEAPYCEIEHNGKFTVRSMTKELAAHGYTPEDSMLLALVRGCNSWDSDEWHVVRIYNNSYDVDMPYCIDHYFRKYDFEDARKEEDCHAIFFAQKKEYLTTARFSRHTYGGYSRRDKEVDYHGRFKNVESVPIYGYGHREHTLDSSGYCLDVYREDLNERVDRYKKEKAKAAYLKTDNSDKIVTLARLIEEYKKKLSSEILTAKTLEEIRKLDSLMGWGGLYDIVSDFQMFTKKTNEQSFNSIDESNNVYDRVAKKCYSYLG